MDELKPISLKTCLAITEIFVDESAIPPPLVVSDIIYTGLADGRVFAFMLRTEYEHTQANKIDFPLVQKEILKMPGRICSIAYQNGIMGVSDVTGAFAAIQTLRPQQSYLKKIAQLNQKSDDVIQNLPAGEVDLVDLVFEFSTSKINNKQQAIPILISEKTI